MYVVAQIAGSKKPALYQVKQQGDKLLGIIPNSTKYGNPTPVAIKSKEIIVRLGEEPPIGSVYGVFVEPIDTRILIKNYGPVYIYIHEMHDSVKNRLMQALPAARKRVMKMGPPLDWDIMTEVRNPKGSLNGTYAYKPQGEDILTLHPATGQGARELAKVIAHELGHGVWNRYMDAAQRSKWIKLYDRYVKVKEVGLRDIKLMVKDIRQIASVRDYLKDIEPEEQASADIYLNWLLKMHQLTKREVQDLVSSGEDLPIPDTHLHKSSTQTPITMYSKKTNAQEFFCEALSSHIVGDLQDKTMIKMLKDLQA